MISVVSLMFIWLGASVFLAVLLQTFLWFFLRRRGVPLDFFYIGTPGYLDVKYINWCRQNEKSYFVVIVLRVVLLLSIIIAVVAIQAP
jgi:hypothetical protein